MNAKTYLISALRVLAEKQNLKISFEYLVSSKNKEDIIFICFLVPQKESSVKNIDTLAKFLSKARPKPRPAYILNNFIDSLEEILHKDFFSEACDKTAEHIIKNLIKKQKSLAKKK